MISTTSGKPRRDVAARLGVPALAVLRVARLGRNHLARIEEVVGDIDGLVEQPAGIVAQVEHDAAQLVAGLLLKAVDRLAQAGVGLLVELGQADIADVAVQPAFDDLDVDDLARERDLDRRVDRPVA